MRPIILAGSDPAFAERLAAAAPERETRVVEPTREALEAASSDGGVVVIGPPLGTDDAFELAEWLLGRDPAPAVVVVADAVDTGVLRRAMRLGVSEVVALKDADAEIAGAIDGAEQRAARAAAEGAAEAPVARRTKVVTVFGTKGGVGKTVLATNLAVALAGMGSDTVLVDLDLQFGDTGIMLQLVPERTIFDAVQAFDRLDTEMLRGFLTQHSSGLRVLLAPTQPEQAESVTSARVTTIIDLLSEIADYVIIDTPASLGDVVLTALERSDVVYAVVTMDVPSIKNVKVSLDKLRQMGVASGARMVLNRADSKVGLQPSEVADATGCEIAARVPSDRLVPLSVNRGVPIVVDAPRCAVSKSMVELAHRINDGSEAVRTDGAQ